MARHVQLSQAQLSQPAIAAPRVRGFDPLRDNIEYGRHLLPLTKKLIAERDAAKAAAE